MASDTGQVEEICMQRLALLYAMDDRGQLLRANEPWGVGDPVPIAHICFGRETVAFGIRAGLPRDVAARLHATLSTLQPDGAPHQITADHPCLGSLKALVVGSRITCGPVYRFPKRARSTGPAVRIEGPDSKHALILSPELLESLRHTQPFYAVVEEGRLASICRTVRIWGRYREAGVHTWDGFRRRGYASAVVGAWAGDVAREGGVPLYSTDWTNRGSLGVAAKLGLILSAVEVKLE